MNATAVYICSLQKTRRSDLQSTPFMKTVYYTQPQQHPAYWKKNNSGSINHQLLR